ncbi:MAG: Type A flavoprotein FprA [Methanocella sp. PtaU1.Bin125]|nr:MAG: Type A flavoprotein FprA [Methanocella sp. PtaU1.Bin125]
MIEVSKGIYWVGAIDWEIRDFHGYATPKGTTYNAYLIVDEKVALVDTVKEPFRDELLSRVGEIVDPAKIDYVIVNHLERDHFGSFAQVMDVAKNAKVYASGRGKKGIEEVYGERWDVTAVKTGDTLGLGKRTLRFVETPMLHWPDSMFTYVEPDRVLISSDAFGQHVAGSQRFDREADPHALMEDAKTYYANILMPFGTLIQGLLAKVPSLNLAPEIIAPDHGLIWTKPGTIIDAYGRWSKFEARDKVVIAYDTMWESTGKMAHLIARGAIDGGVEVKLFHLRKSPYSEAVTEIQDAKAFIIGSPTLNNGLFPTVGGFLYYLKGLKPKHKIATAFGSYGWMGGAVKEIVARLKEMELELAEPALDLRYPVTKQQEQECIEFGRKIAKQVKEAKQ